MSPTGVTYFAMRVFEVFALNFRDFAGSHCTLRRLPQSRAICPNDRKYATRREPVKEESFCPSSIYAFLTPTLTVFLFSFFFRPCPDSFKFKTALITRPYTSLPQAGAFSLMRSRCVFRGRESHPSSPADEITKGVGGSRHCRPALPYRERRRRQLSN